MTHEQIQDLCHISALILQIDLLQQLEYGSFSIVWDYGKKSELYYSLIELLFLLIWKYPLQ